MTGTDLDKLLQDGVAYFNEQKYFEAHEVWEDLWRQQVDPEKEFTQGLIQVAVGLYHLLRDNHAGAQKLLKRGTDRLKKYPVRYCGVDTADVMETAQKILLELQTGEVETNNLPRLSFAGR